MRTKFNYRAWIIRLLTAIAGGLIAAGVILLFGAPHWAAAMTFIIVYFMWGD
jgi:hypothetical protein